VDQLKYALGYLKMGFSVIPCQPDKKALVPWTEYQTRLTSVDEVKNWWKKYSGANIGCVCDPISRLTVIDCDSLGAWDSLQGYFIDLRDAPISITPTGNKQIFFKHWPGLHSQNRVMPDTDIKTDGGYLRDQFRDEVL
jgi:hypothetical protein